MRQYHVAKNTATTLAVLSVFGLAALILFALPIRSVEKILMENIRPAAFGIVILFTVMAGAIFMLQCMEHTGKITHIPHNAELSTKQKKWIHLTIGCIATGMLLLMICFYMIAIPFPEISTIEKSIPIAIAAFLLIVIFIDSARSMLYYKRAVVIQKRIRM